MASPSPEPSRPGQGAAYLLHETDNVLVATRSMAAGTILEIDGVPHRLATDIELGHKIARRALKQGDKVIRYGLPIGSMTSAADIGGHVHNHNLKSDYIPAHGRDAIRSREIRS